MSHTQEPANVTEEPAKELLNYSQEDVQRLGEVLKLIPVDILLPIMKTIPTCGIKVLECIDATYAYWRASHAHAFKSLLDFLKNVNWTKYMGGIRNQGRCNICWTVVVADLVAALLFLKKIDPVHTEYSIQDLLDFAAPWKLIKKPNSKHCCFTYTINKGLQYVAKNGLQKEVDRPFVGCRERHMIPPRIDSILGRIRKVEKLSFAEALVMLKSQMIGASLHIFMPDYQQTNAGIYRGPMLLRSKFRGMHAVTIVGVGEENGEYYFIVKSTHGSLLGNEGYFKVSMEVMLCQIPTATTVSHGKLEKPVALITNFCCPIIDEVKEDPMETH